MRYYYRYLRAERNIRGNTNSPVKFDNSINKIFRQGDIIPVYLILNRFRGGGLFELLDTTGSPINDCVLSKVPFTNHHRVFSATTFINENTLIANKFVYDHHLLMEHFLTDHALKISYVRLFDCFINKDHEVLRIFNIDEAVVVVNNGLIMVDGEVMAVIAYKSSTDCSLYEQSMSTYRFTEGKDLVIYVNNKMFHTCQKLYKKIIAQFQKEFMDEGVNISFLNDLDFRKSFIEDDVPIGSSLLGSTNEDLNNVLKDIMDDSVIIEEAMTRHNSTMILTTPASFYDEAVRLIEN